MAKRGSNSLKAMEIYAGLYYPISNKVCDKCYIVLGAANIIPSILNFRPKRSIRHA